MKYIALLFLSVLAACGVVPQRGPARSQRAKLEQQIGPLATGPTSLRSALIKIVAELREPVAIDVCSDLQDKNVNVTLDKAERLDVVLQAVAIQAGAQLRLYVGQHGEVAHPTFFCSPADAGHLVTLGR